jgi:threonine/homoserine/homoserine lactone efflux protein
LPGKRAGFISLAGVAVGFFFYMLCAAFGITALVFAVPYAYDALRLCGVAYLLYLAWQAIKPGGGRYSRCVNYLRTVGVSCF